MILEITERQFECFKRIAAPQSLLIRKHRNLNNFSIHNHRTAGEFRNRQPGVDSGKIRIERLFGSDFKLHYRPPRRLPLDRHAYLGHGSRHVIRKARMRSKE